MHIIKNLKHFWKSLRSKATKENFIMVFIGYLIGVFFGIINVLEWNLIFAILFTLPSLLFIFPKQILNFKMGAKKTEKKDNDFNVYTNTNRQQTMKRFKTKSQNNEVIDGDYEIINENDKNKN